MAAQGPHSRRDQLPLGTTDGEGQHAQVQALRRSEGRAGKAGITPDKNIIAYCGTSREGSLLMFYLKHVAGYPKVRLYEGAWKEYVWLKGKSLPAETGGDAAGK